MSVTVNRVLVHPTNPVEAGDRPSPFQPTAEWPLPLPGILVGATPTFRLIVHVERV